MSRRSTTTLSAAATAVLTAAILAGCGGSDRSTVADGCEPEHEFDTINEGALTVTAYDLPPYSQVQGNELQGLDGDILREIAANECLEIQVESAAAAAIIPTIQAGRADVAAGNWYRTAERAEIVDLSDPIYTDQMAIISAEGTSDIQELPGRRVGTVDGYLWVADLREYLGEELTIYNSPLNMYQDLSAGRIDIAIDSYGSGVYNTEGDDVSVEVAEPFSTVAASVEAAQSSFPVPKGSQELLEAINTNIDRLRESGRLAELLEEHGLDPSAAETGEPRLIGG
ncbi:ABC transporter substrate-binding protein [uncultured Aeromicrobium sp.]|uniref:substrate-binding periplasmic protein n=1 Tax=uncultured Aeromicrobium sp. TaxID=337820 RepID=UPI0025EFA0A6|nr:ABC transporter substrate-binding protein [uncultured Aeromicrobium sp.]